jgi:hypothetical protein
MRNLLAIAVLGALAWTGYSSYQSHSAAEIEDQQRFSPVQAGRETTFESAAFNCDGRIYCSQMTSCAEATYFLQHCPGVRMDGGGDGVPCESQWCGDR